MAKKKSNAGQLISFVSVILGIAALVMLFLPVVQVKEIGTTYSGLNVTFGYKEKVVVAEAEIFKFSFMNLLTYILAAAGILFAILSALAKGGKFASFISAVAFLVAGVFFFLVISFSVLPVEGALGDAFKDTLALAYGSIVGGVASILAGLGMAYKTFVK